MKQILMALLTSAIMSATQFAAAQEATPTTPIVGDPAAGQQKITTCAACHGQDGNSPIPVNPNLAAQHPEYITQALIEYQKGIRPNPVMAGMAAGLSAQDIADIAAYYSTQAEKVGEADPALVKQGEALYRAGDQDRGIPACMACHGPVGDGNGPAKFPRVANQNPDYVLAALKEYQSGTRPSPNNMMNDIAERLSDKEMQAVASYIYGRYPTGMKLSKPTPTAAPAGQQPAGQQAAGQQPAVQQAAGQQAAGQQPASVSATTQSTAPPTTSAAPASGTTQQQPKQ